MKELTIEAKVENLPAVLAHIDAELEANDCPMKVQMQIDVAVEELFVNVASYAYAPKTGEAMIGIEITDSMSNIISDGAPGNYAVICFRDCGTPFDPTAKEDPDVTLSAEQRQIGGLGIYMVKKSMDAFIYRYDNGQNILTIVKKL